MKANLNLILIKILFFSKVLVYNIVMAKLKNVVFKTNEMEQFKLKCSRIFLYLCLLLVAVSIIFNVTYSIAPVSGKSMYPTINADLYDGVSQNPDRVVLNHIKSYKKGDVIVAKKTSNDESEIYVYVIKRLIAVGGDRVEVVSNGDVYINDKLLVEDYVKSNKIKTYINIQSLKLSQPQLFEGNVLVVPKGYVFYLGDNRSNSIDCSTLGPVSENDIIAKADYLIKSDENIFISILKQIFGEKRLW